MDGFLPVNKQDLEQDGVGQPDFILITGDAYVDHPSFAHAVISRYLVAHGYSVGIIAQPNWKKTQSFTVLGEPRLGFLVSPGNMDSMVSLYTVAKKKREKDLYSPGGRQGKRPPRAAIVYTQKLKEAYPNSPVILGGIEASLRRFAHYDYWDNKVMPSILADSGADLLVYGMGERAIVEIAEALDGGLRAQDITYVQGTCYKANDLSRVYEYEKLPSLGEVRENKRTFAKAFNEQMFNRNNPLVQKNGGVYIVQNIPAQPLNTRELDFVYSLPYTRRAHPMYKEPVPALAEAANSITAVRGCVGGCAFCALYYHQGKCVSSRSKKSILAEAETIKETPGFKGTISDVGGPTANLYGMKCMRKGGMCQSRRCLVPSPCKHLKESHAAYIDVLRSIRNIPGIKHVFVRSGIRHDLALMDKSGEFIRELAKHHVSGQLKLAPEHVSGSVLHTMGKPEIEVYEKFKQKFDAISESLGKKQYVLPYFMSSHPGCKMDDAVTLAEYIRDSGFMPDTAQDFYPTPGTLATCMYYTGIDPQTGKSVYAARKGEEKAMQRALIQYKNPANRPLVKKALLAAKRFDLMGKGKKSLW
ncbi:MAG: YgiQ family radical SAM protein [Christensenellaceae bacterium]|jgi:uncharacterized radical SAM protein YgiQ